MKYHLYTHDQQRGTWMTAQYEDTISDAIKWGIDLMVRGKMESFTLCAEDRAGRFSFIPGDNDNASGDEWFVEYAEENELPEVIAHYEEAKSKSVWMIIEDQDEDDWDKCDQCSLEYVRSYEPSATELLPKFALISYNMFAELKYELCTSMYFEGSYWGDDDEPNTEEEITDWKAARDAFVSQCEKYMAQ
ncbi:MAG: hypothetical protein FD119_2584 [Stygiobacter sp.]|nr:MAG: hypothetical protein FD119_2584 [Stygiobacter sp.]